MKKRKTKTTIAVRQVYVIREPEIYPLVHCRQCSTGAPSMVRPEEAAVVAGVPVRGIYRLVEAGAIHHLEMEDGSLLVCLNSLPKL